MWVVAGLGNPGKEYSGTRHNVGFTLVKRAARRWGVELKKRKFMAKMGEMKRDGERVVMVLPQTYMNRSGSAVKLILDSFRVTSENLVVVYDDLDIPPGEIRVRKEGRPGTHKGMRSIVEEIGTTRFPRIRVGVGTPAPGEDAVHFVLSPFSDEELGFLERSLASAEEALRLILAGEIEKAMNKFNRKSKGTSA